MIDLTLAAPPGEATHWSVRAMANVSSIGAVSGPRIWRSNSLMPHRMRTFKLSNDPRFVEKFTDVVGLYVDPPAHAVVLSIDETGSLPHDPLGACSPDFGPRAACTCSRYLSFRTRYP